MTDAIYRFLLPGLAGPHRLVPLRSLADSELSGNALAVAAKRGRLRAVRRTAQWYTTKQWVEQYKDSRYKRSDLSESRETQTGRLRPLIVLVDAASRLPA